MLQESLLPGTKAIGKATVEWQRNRRGYLVRYKALSGSVVQRQFRNPEECDAFFWECVGKMEKEIMNCEL